MPTRPGPYEHYCEEPGCHEWGSHGTREATVDGKRTVWRCWPHDKAHQQKIAADATAPRQAAPVVPPPQGALL